MRQKIHKIYTSYRMRRSSLYMVDTMADADELSRTDLVENLIRAEWIRRGNKYPVEIPEDYRATNSEK